MIRKWSYRNKHKLFDLSVFKQRDNKACSQFHKFNNFTLICYFESKRSIKEHIRKEKTHFKSEIMLNKLLHGNIDLLMVLNVHPITKDILSS